MQERPKFARQEVKEEMQEKKKPGLREIVCEEFY